MGGARGQPDGRCGPEKRTPAGGAIARGGSDPAWTAAGASAMTDGDKHATAPCGTASAGMGPEWTVLLATGGSSLYTDGAQDRIAGPRRRTVTMR
jgi:hypothetical protein